MLKTNKFYNETVATQFGEVTFDESGKSNNLKPEDSKYLADRIPGFIHVEDPKVEAPKEAKPKEEAPKEDKPKEEAPKEEAPKKTTKKPAPKKETNK